MPFGSLNGGFRSGAQHLGEGCVDPEQPHPAVVLAGSLLPSRERLWRSQPCIRGQWGYLEGVMITLVKNLRLLVHGGCLKAGR